MYVYLYAYIYICVCLHIEVVMGKVSYDLCEMKITEIYLPKLHLNNLKYLSLKLSNEITIGFNRWLEMILESSESLSDCLLD